MKWVAKVLIGIGMFALRIFVNISCKLIKKVYNLIKGWYNYCEGLNVSFKVNDVGVML